jgi:hypothetical protein
MSYFNLLKLLPPWGKVRKGVACWGGAHKKRADKYNELSALVKEFLLSKV